MPAEYLFGAADPLAVFLDGGATRVMSADPAFPGVPSLPAMPPVPLPAAALAGIRDGSSVELSLPDMLPGAAATDSSGGSGSGGTGSGTASGGSGSMGTPAAAATSPPALRGRAGGKGGRKELTEEQKERIKAKNRRWVLGAGRGGAHARGGGRYACGTAQGRCLGTRFAAARRFVAPAFTAARLLPRACPAGRR